ncbi:MAG: SH3 domain-containing protein, partial [Chloroflexota bacterium]
MSHDKSLWLRAVFIMLCGYLFTLPAFGQSDMATPPPETTPEVTAVATNMPEVQRGVVSVESAFVRAAPDLNSDSIASVFERDTLEIIGRNADGLWFEVRRPNRTFSLGWISAALLDLDFFPETLPMTDATTGVIGEQAIPIEHTAVYLVAEANIRAAPEFGSEILVVAPLGAILPATGRDSGLTWIYVNYRGTIGWVNIVTIRRPPALLDLPDIAFELTGIAPLPVVVIPPEVQLSQVQAFRDFVTASRDVASDLVPFWETILEGEIMPCEPPDFVTSYLVTAQDVQELPELNRFVPRYNEGVDLL